MKSPNVSKAAVLGRALPGAGSWEVRLQPREDGAFQAIIGEMAAVPPGRDGPADHLYVECALCLRPGRDHRT